MGRPVRTPQPGETFEGRYGIEAVLGEGGFSRVYRGRDVDGNVVALKVLTMDDGSAYEPATRGRYMREAKVLASLGNPHTVRLLDSGESASGLLWLVFEYIDGRSLDAVLAEHGTLPPADVAHVMRQVLKSLNEAHEAGLAHRDIKPANILVYDDGEGDDLRVKVIDFGIARGREAGTGTVTQEGEVVGTPRYMAPEQLLSQRVTPAADLYSLGLVGLELLAGRDSLPGDSLADQFARMRGDYEFTFPDLGSMSVLTQVIERMIVREPEQRFQSAQHVLTMLRSSVLRRQ